MVPQRTVVLLVVGSLALGGMLGFGTAQALSGSPAGAGAAGAGRAGGAGGGGLPGTPRGLPTGLSRDINGMIQGTNLRMAPGSEPLEWAMLSAYTYTKDQGFTDLPENLRALEGKKVTVLGFLMPFFEFDDIHQFALVGSCWSCCFGRAPTLAETLNVTLREGHAGLRNDLEPLRVVGTFRAKVVMESGYLLSIFSIEDAEAAPLE